MTKKSGELTNDLGQFAQMGIAALLPGMQHMLTLMQKACDEQRELLTALQGITPATEAPRRGRPPGVKNTVIGGNSGWPTDPMERKKEAARRRAVGEERKNAKLHPRDPKHPDHEKWRKGLRGIQRKFWDKLTPAQKRARLDKLAAGKKKAERERKKTARAAVEEMKVKEVA